MVIQKEVKRMCGILRMRVIPNAENNIIFERAFTQLFSAFGIKWV